VQCACAYLWGDGLLRVAYSGGALQLVYRAVPFAERRQSQEDASAWQMSGHSRTSGRTPSRTTTETACFSC